MSMIQNTMTILSSIYQPQASAHAEKVDKVQDLINNISFVSFAVIIGLMAYFCWVYRRKGKDEKTPLITHNLLLEVVWSVVPLFFLIYIFIEGYGVYRDVKTPPASATGVETVYVTGRKWAWEFQFKNGGSVGSTTSLVPGTVKDADKAARLAATEAGKDPEQVKESQKLILPVGRPVKLVIRATDVLHSFAIPAMRVKQDAIPGQTRSIWFTPSKIGEYIYTCNENCGQNHAFMVGYMKVVSEEEYAKFLDSIAPVVDPVINGERLYQKQCMSCHSTDGARLVGPSWKGIFGSDRPLNSGHATADEAYIIESIRNPNAKVAKGYPAAMPPFSLSDKQIQDIIEYMKTLK